MATKSDVRKAAFIKRLSQITSMDLTLIGIENPNMIMSLVKYLTGLNSARMHILMNPAVAIHKKKRFATVLWT